MTSSDILFLYDNTLSALKTQMASAGNSGFYVLSNPSPAQPVNNWVITMGKGVLDYNVLVNKPSIDGIILSGDVTSSELGLASLSTLSSDYVPYDYPIKDVNLRDKTLFLDLLVSQNDLSSSIDLGNQTIYDNTSAISFEWTTRLFKDSQEVNSIDYENRDLNGNWTLNGSSFASSLTSKIDTVPTATSGDLAVWNASGGIYDSSLPLSSVLILDNLGQIDQMRYLPSIYLKNKTPSLTAFCHEIWVETNEYDEDYVVVGGKVRIDPSVPMTFTWTGIVDGNLSDYRNYNPKIVPTSIDNVIVDETCTNQPSSGSLTCSLLSVQNNGTIPSITDVVLGASCSVTGDVEFNSLGLTYLSENDATLDTATFNGDSVNDGTVITGTFNDGSYNNGGGIVTTGTFNGSSYNNGTVTTGTFSGYGSSYNSYYGFVTDGTFNGSSYNIGNVTTGTFNDISYNGGGSVTTGTFNDSSYNSWTVTTGTFNDSSYNGGGSVTTGTFNDSSYNSYYGFVTTGTFNDISSNAGGTVTDGTFNDSSRNNFGGSVTTGTFNDSSRNYIGVVATGTFNDSSYNSWTVTTGTFNDSSYNNSGSVTTGTFNGSSFNDGFVATGTFNDSSYNSWTVTTGTFNDSSYNHSSGTVTTGTFYPTPDGFGGWSFTTNEGTVFNATCYWLGADNALGGTITNLPVIYLGYPV